MLSANSKTINDPVHGVIELPPVCAAVIDTPQFQRLQKMKQLGGGYFAFSGATHTRFEHSIGVCHLAGQLVKALQERQPDLQINNNDILCVQLAGLCHDLGYGPFSHVFDDMFIPRIKPDSKWKIEEASIVMFDYMLKDKGGKLEAEFKKHGLRDKDIILIKEIIKGPPAAPSDKKAWQYEGRARKKAFLYEIVTNHRNGIDADTLDSLVRDSHHLRVTTNLDFKTFIEFARVIDVEGHTSVCFRKKQIHKFFSTRLLLTRQIYQHRNVTIVEQMIFEAMMEADNVIKIPNDEKRKRVKMSECVDPEHVDAYVNLTDDVILRKIQKSKPGLEKAQRIIASVQQKHFYECVGETEPIPSHHFTKKHPVKEDILANLGAGCDAFPGHVIIQNYLVISDKTNQCNNKYNEWRMVCEVLDNSLWCALLLHQKLWNSYRLDYHLSKKDSDFCGKLSDCEHVLSTASIFEKILNFDITKNESNPLEEIRFYNKNEPSRAKTATGEEVLQLLPLKHFSEQIIRVLLKPSEDEGKDRKRKQELEKAFNVWYEKERKHLKSAP